MRSLCNPLEHQFGRICKVYEPRRDSWVYDVSIVAAKEVVKPLKLELENQFCGNCPQTGSQIGLATPGDSAAAVVKLIYRGRRRVPRVQSHMQSGCNWLGNNFELWRFQYFSIFLWGNPQKLSQLTLLHKSYTEDGTLVSISSKSSCRVWSPISNLKMKSCEKTARIGGGKFGAPAEGVLALTVLKRDNLLRIILNTGNLHRQRP